jgi:hypothetical protein
VAVTRDELLVRLVEQHRTQRRPYWGAATPGLFLVKCAACDGDRVHVWAPGDPEYACELWRAAVDLGVAA